MRLIATLSPHHPTSQDAPLGCVYIARLSTSRSPHTPGGPGGLQNICGRPPGAPGDPPGGPPLGVPFWRTPEPPGDPPANRGASHEEAPEPPFSAPPSPPLGGTGGAPPTPPTLLRNQFEAAVGRRPRAADTPPTRATPPIYCV